jgi:uncharacterized membrane protein YdjX (TVP38/TMEM64 family)
VLQIVVAAIPGEVVQIAGGYIFGTLAGTLYLMTGVVLGTLIVFYASRMLGYPLVRVFVSESRLEKFGFIINSGKSEIAVFVLFLIPGLPKDVITYVAGLTPIKPLRFIALATLGRLPALFASAFIGANLQQKDYYTVFVLSALAVVLFFAGIILKDRIIELLHNILNPRGD